MATAWAVVFVTSVVLPAWPALLSAATRFGWLLLRIAWSYVMATR